MSYKRLSEEINAEEFHENVTVTDTFVESQDPLEKEAPDNILPESRVLSPMSAWAGAATIINLVLATGPFSYPYAFVK
jgi:hypothetical protein